MYFFPAEHLQNRTCFIECSSMTSPYTLIHFENGMRNLFSKQLIKYPCILSTSKRESIGDFASNISAAKAIAKGPQLYASGFSGGGKVKKLKTDSFTQLLYNEYNTIEHIFFCLNSFYCDLLHYDIVTLTIKFSKIYTYLYKFNNS